MTYLFFSTSSLAYPHFGVQLEEALSKHEEGHKVIFAYCDGVINTCFKNIDSSPIICQACKFGYNATLKSFEDKFEVIKLKKTSDVVNHKFNFNNIPDIKSIEYRGVSVGYSVLSFYISLKRDPAFILSLPVKSYIDNLLAQACSLVDAAHTIIGSTNPDSVCIFNGRFFETKPFFDVGKNNNLEVIVNEVIGNGLENNPIYLTNFINATPHDIPNLADKVLKTWNKSDLNDEEKYQIGESFFYNKRYGNDTGLVDYTHNQKLGSLPINWDKSKKNIVIFNSSEDEFAAIGKEFDAYSIFPTQIEGIKLILGSIRDSNIHFYLRIHPNLYGVSLPYHTELLKLDSLYENCTVISAESVISTYTLIDACWKVIVFGSTVGIESVFWGKPTILLAGAMYHDLNALYKPRNSMELIDLVYKDLVVGDPKPAVKFGYYIMERDTSYHKPKYLNLDLKEYKFFKRRFLQPRYQTFFRSTLFFKLIVIFYLKFKYRLFPKTKFYYNK